MVVQLFAGECDGHGDIVREGRVYDAIAMSTRKPDLRELAWLAMRNVKGLAGDARMLLDAGRFPRALSLSVLCLEEFTKFFVLVAAADAEAAGKPFERDTLMLALSSHQAKLIGLNAIVRKLAAKHPTLLGRFEGAVRGFGGDMKSASLYNELKLKGFYVSIWRGAAGGPESHIDHTLAAATVAQAEAAVDLLNSVDWEL